MRCNTFLVSLTRSSCVERLQIGLVLRSPGGLFVLDERIPPNEIDRNPLKLSRHTFRPCVFELNSCN